MDIKLKHISILNFKGIRSFETDFDENESEFRGDNATGKTSLFDAFSWCLYGKDSSGRSDSNFQIKTLDTDNKVIPRIPHEVSVTLSVDGNEVILRKCYSEEWKKRRGSAVEQFSGHIIERFWNEVPCSEREYNAKIQEICPEEVFRLITNPLEFLTMSKKDQRAFLINMAGDITPEIIAERYPEFKRLVVDMSGKTTEEYAREIGAKIKRIKVEMEGIPQRIDERKRDMPAEVDVDSIRGKHDAIQKEIDSLDGQIANGAKAFAEANKRRQELIRQISSLELQLSQRESEIRTNVCRDYYERQAKKDSICRELSRVRSQLSETQRKMAQKEQEMHDSESARLSLIDEWRNISARQFPTPSEDEFICPTCGRKLENDAIAEKITEMADRFNTKKSLDLEENKKKGLKAKADIERLKTEVLTCQKDIEKLKGDISVMEGDPDYIWNDPEPNAEKFLRDDVKANSFRSHIDALKSEAESEPDAPDQTELKQKRMDLLSRQQELTEQLLQQETRVRSEERIRQLEEQLKSQNEEIASLEGTQYQIELFKHRMIDEVEATINSMFSIVKFKMYEEQINGGERETCEALVGGIPFSTNLNTAARINAGIDVINAVSRHYGVHAPIFIDNRESITTVIPTDSQIINLVKDEKFRTLTCTK